MDICEIYDSELEKIMIVNEAAKPNSRFCLKLHDDASEEECRKFCEYVYALVGLDIYDFVPKEMKNEKEHEEFMKKYGQYVN